ncbi:MAG: hypothetical protein ACTHOF_08740 [Flavisolibacter sp.]|jgi:hypothetical protein
MSLRAEPLYNTRFFPIFAPGMTKKALGLAEFEEMAFDLQFEVLHRDGVHVGKRKVDDQIVILFQLYTFYVEVHYIQYRKVIDHIVTAEGTDILQPYLDQIHVKDLKDKSKGQ